MYIEQLREMFPLASHSTVGVCNQITLLIPYYISSRLVTLPKIIDAPIQVSDIYYYYYYYYYYSVTVWTIRPPDARCYCLLNV